jgi:hypothetical protein
VSFEGRERRRRSGRRRLRIREERGRRGMVKGLEDGKIGRWEDWKVGRWKGVKRWKYEKDGKECVRMCQVYYIRRAKISEGTVLLVSW